MPNFTAADLKKFLHYDPFTGIFTWIASRPNAPVGHKCTALNKGGYVTIGFRNKYHAAHRLAWLYMTGSWPDGEIDHINRVKSDNRWANLRVVDRAANIHNANVGRENSSGIRGIYFDKRYRRWTAEIRAHGQRIYLGAFMSAEAAGAAYEDARSRLHTPVPLCNPEIGRQFSLF